MGVFRQGNVAFKAARYAEALAHYSEAVALDPTATAARANRAMALIKLQRYGAVRLRCDGGHARQCRLTSTPRRCRPR